MAVEQLRLEVLECCRASTGMGIPDFAAAFGLAAGAIPPNAKGGTKMDIVPLGKGEPVAVYAIAREGRFLIGLRVDFEKLGLMWGKWCDVIDKRAEKRVYGKW